MGLAVLPHLSPMVDMIEHGLNDKNPKVSMITAQAVADLAKAAHPYGIECFGGVLKPLFEGVCAFQQAFVGLSQGSRIRYSSHGSRLGRRFLVRCVHAPHHANSYSRVL